MATYRFWWDDLNIDHIAEHDVEWAEAEEVFRNKPHIVRTGGEKYIAYGQTFTGRYLFVVFAKKLEQRIRVVTARDMTDGEKRNHKTRRK